MRAIKSGCLSRRDTINGVSMRSIDKKLEYLKITIPQVEPKVAFQRYRNGAIIIDVREHYEVIDGMAHGARHIQRGLIDLSIENDIPDYSQDLLLICESGLRSLLVAGELKMLGYCNVASIRGGMQRWKSEGLPVTKKVASMAD